MTAATTKIERSGPAIRAVLAEASPAEFDLAPAEAVLDRWWGIAAIRANPLSEQEQAQLARASTTPASQPRHASSSTPGSSSCWRTRASIPARPTTTPPISGRPPTAAGPD
ncbi:MAG: hypothetical protein GEU83_21070 [Pseudonocardiaceae bacterium]|nr:hypothetical protein [Pseudonocardiaceae bacterium]